MNLTNRTWAELNFDEIIRNYQALQEAAAGGMRILALEPANNYTFEPMIGGPVRDLTPHYLAVDTLEDGCTLRQKGVTLPILVRKFPWPDNIASYVKTLHWNFLSQCVDSFEAVAAISGRVIPMFGGMLSIHMKVNISAEGEGFHYLDKDSPIDDFISAKSKQGMYYEGLYTELKKDEPDEEKMRKMKALAELEQRIESVTHKPFAIRHFICE